MFNDNADVVDCKVKEWLEWDQNPETRAEINELVKCNDVDELKHRLCSRMTFGTAGLRARMAAGYCFMNDLTIIQTTQGFVCYMEEICPQLRNKGVVIGYDARHNSYRWAKMAATILLHRGIRVYLFSQVCPTPFVPYGVMHLGCDWGLMITASHNPKEDNGYKVYYSNGAQIISPHDKGISEKILANLCPWSTSWDMTITETSSLCTDPYDNIMSSYMAYITELSYYSDLNCETPLKFTYSAMHGVGYKAIQQAAKAFHLPAFIPVVEQVEPDPEFPTVKFPNPEEGKSALELSILTADKHQSTLILANDPDADRLAVAEKLPEGNWHLFGGNELGALIGWWRWMCHKGKNPLAGSDCYTLASTVSSKILRTISHKEGFQFRETLTGFKWMGNVASQLQQQGKTVVFAFEEAIGFMCGLRVLDKDGVSAAMVAAEMAVFLHSQGLTLMQQLEKIYNIYGYHVTQNSYFLCYEPATVETLFNRLRDWNGSGKYPDACGPYKISYIRDLTTGYDNSQPDNKAVLPTSRSSQMITFTFENGCEVTMRTSGTEPKIKYYSEFAADPDKGLDRNTVTAELGKLVDSLIKYFFEPEKNKLIAQSC